MTTKVTRDVSDFKTRAITDGLRVEGDCSANFALNGISIGLTTPCDAQFLDVLAQTLQLTGDFNLNGARITNMGAPVSGQDGANKAYVDAALGVGSVGNDFIPLGTMVPYPSDSAPSGWLLCDGETVGNAVSGATYADSTYEDIFNFLKDLPPNAGTEDFGSGDSVVLPDMQGRTAIGVDPSAAVVTSGDAASLGAALGESEIALTEAQMPAHTHSGTTSTAGGHTHTYFGHGGGSSKNGCCTPWDSPVPRSTSYAGAHSHTVSITSSGGGEAHGNMQPSLAVNWIIKAIPSIIDQDVLLADGSVSMESGANLQFSGGGTPTGLPVLATGATDAVSKQHLDNALSALSFDSDYIRLNGTNTPTTGLLTLGANLDVANNRLTNVPDSPAAATDAVNENYVDSAISTALTGYVTHLGSGAISVASATYPAALPVGPTVFSDTVLLTNSATVAVVYAKVRDGLAGTQLNLTFESGAGPNEVWVPTTTAAPGDFIAQQIMVPITTPGQFTWSASPGVSGDIWLVGYVR